MRCMLPTYRSMFCTITFGAYRTFRACVRSIRAVRNHFFLLMYPSFTVHSVRSDTMLLSILLNLKASLFPPRLESKVVTRRLPCTENAIPVVKHIGIVLVTQQHKEKIQAGMLEIVQATGLHVLPMGFNSHGRRGNWHVVFP
jgi:hypothetical protein